MAQKENFDSLNSGSFYNTFDNFQLENDKCHLDPLRSVFVHINQKSSKINCPHFMFRRLYGHLRLIWSSDFLIQLIPFFALSQLESHSNIPSPMNALSLKCYITCLFKCYSELQIN